MSDEERAQDRINAWCAAEMASCLRNPKRPPPSGDFNLLVKGIAQALADVRAEENEACAKVAEDEMAWCELGAAGDIRDGQVGASSRIAAAIRARQDRARRG